MKKVDMLIIPIITLFLVSCTLENSQGDMEDITVKLKWLHQAQFTGNYVAEEQGFYAEEGLDVKFEEFSYDFPAIESVASGKAQFGITGADELLIARSKGIPVKAFAVIYKTSPNCAYTLADSGIRTPYDFVGKTVGLEKGTNVETTYLAMMSKLGINRSKIEEIGIGFTAEELLDGKVDVSTGYSINEPRQVIEAGKDVHIMLMADYGVNIYGDVLFTTEDMINNYPDMVERFLRATLKGWQHAIEDQDAAVETVMRYASGSTISHEKYMLEKSIPLIHTGSSEIGKMKSERWEDLAGFLIDHDMLEKSIDLGQAYTMEFLDMIYG